MAVKTFGVIGAGQMGNGIAQVAASPGGLNVIMNDIADQFVDKGYDTISKNLDRLVAKEKLTADQKKEIMSRIKKSTKLEDMKDADFVVEAATEREDLKLGVFRKLDEVCKRGYPCHEYVPIPITRIAGATKRPALVIGMHFYEPRSRDETRRDHQGFGYLSRDVQHDRGPVQAVREGSCRVQ